jgi:hypothetical protein
MNRQRCYDHICTRTHTALSALKLELAKREREMRRLVCTEENASSDMAMVSAKCVPLPSSLQCFVSCESVGDELTPPFHHTRPIPLTRW